MRMIACTAYMSDYDLNSDQTQTFVYACLAGVAVNSLLKQAERDRARRSGSPRRPRP